jgi:hypothetical protein
MNKKKGARTDKKGATPLNGGKGLFAPKLTVQSTIEVTNADRFKQF